MIRIYLRSVAAIAADLCTTAGDAVHHAGALAAAPFDAAAWRLHRVANR